MPKARLDRLEQLVAHRAVVALERDHEAHAPVLGGVGVARQRADAGQGAGLVGAAVAALHQLGVRHEEVEHLGKTAGGEMVATADARALLEIDGIGEAVRGEDFVRRFERLVETDGAAVALGADLQEDLVGDVVVRADEQLVDDRPEAARLAMNIDRLEALGHGPGGDLALHAAAGAADERGDQLAGIEQAQLGILGQADAAAALAGRAP